MPRRLIALAVLGLFGVASLVPGRAHAQAPPHVDETHASLNWILGRWRMPVTCVREDGTTVDVEDAIVFRPAPEDARGRTVRATFFGLDVAGARRCYNLLQRRVPDRRGVIDLTFVSHVRPDLGLRRLRRTLETGEIRYEILRGRVEVREIGVSGGEAERIEFQGKGARLEVRLLERGSDGFKLLAPLARSEPADGIPLRRLELRIRAAEIPAFGGFYAEDGSRRPGR